MQLPPGDWWIGIWEKGHLITLFFSKQRSFSRSAESMRVNKVADTSGWRERVLHYSKIHSAITEMVRLGGA